MSFPLILSRRTLRAEVIFLPYAPAYEKLLFAHRCVGLDAYNSSVGNFDSPTSFLFMALFNSGSGISF